LDSVKQILIVFHIIQSLSSTIQMSMIYLVIDNRTSLII